jgi:hypothetical protein
MEEDKTIGVTWFYWANEGYDREELLDRSYSGGLSSSAV